MKRPLIYSATLHITVLILLLIGFYNPFESTKRQETPMMIEFVNIAEQSAAPMLAPEVIKEVEQPEAPKPTPAPPSPQPDPEPAPPPEPQPQPEPEPVKPEPLKPEPQPDPQPDQAELIPDPKAKKLKEKEKPKEEKKKQKAEITLDKKKKPKSKADEKKDDKKKDKKKKSSKPSKSLEDIFNELENEQANDDEGEPSRGKGAPAATIGPVLTASEKDALSRHMSRCWLIPAGLRDARNIRVPIKINVARDGTVLKAEIQEKGRMASDTAYRTAAESARRAVLDPNCSPLPIPPDKYEIFKEFVFNFDPKEMF
jgi:hypothetical protein